MAWLATPRTSLLALDARAAEKFTLMLFVKPAELIRADIIAKKKTGAPAGCPRLRD
jgi:hypothetical protein